MRMIHAAGMVGLAPIIRFSPGFVAAARARARSRGADPLRRAHGERGGDARRGCRRRTKWSARCTTPRSPTSPRSSARRARRRRWSSGGRGSTGAVVAIGNAPTALFHLLNMLEDPGCPRPGGDHRLPGGLRRRGREQGRAVAGPAGCPAASSRGGSAAARSQWPRSTRWRAGRNDRYGPRRRPRPRRSGPDERPGRPAGPRRATRRLLPQGRARRAGAADRRGDARARRGGASDGISGDDRDALRQRLLPRDAGRVLR